MPTPNPVLAELAAKVAATIAVEESAVVLINGIAARVQAAVDAALANGATEAQLAPLADLAAALDAESNTLANAVASNTSA